MYLLFGLLKLAQTCVSVVIQKQARIYAWFLTTLYISLNFGCNVIASTIFKVHYRIAPGNLSIFSLKICVLQIISLPWIELLKTKRINQLYIHSVEPG